MRRLSLSIAAILLALLGLWGDEQGASGQGAKDSQVKKVRLKALYQAYQAYEVSQGQPARKIDDLSLRQEDVKELKRWLNLDALGLSLADTPKADQKKTVMVYEKEAPQRGGLVMFYDGSIQTLSAAAVRKLVGKMNQ